jgi:tetratricopeptide (TPR) repeat protein
MNYSLCMNKATFVVFFGLIVNPLAAAELSALVASLENDWAVAYYQSDVSVQRKIFPVLLQRAADLVQRFPEEAEPKIWQATIMTTNAGLQSSLTALSSIESAKTLLEQAIKQNPLALEGAAFATLGTLYYKVPAWPVSFGNNKIAEEMLKASLKINPQGIDANFFYADYLLTEGRENEAEGYLNKALASPLRKNQIIADTQLQNQARLALNQLQINKHRPEAANRFMSFFATSNYAK